MKYHLFGKSGLRVSEVCLGTMTFGDQWQGWGMAVNREEARKVFDAYVAAGGNFIDTANGYNAGESEKFVGEFIARERERFVVATKYSMTMRPDDPNGGGNHRKNLVQSLDASLRRLGTDYVDLYWLHIWDSTTPFEELMRALDDVVRAGKVLYVGISDAPAWVVARANTLAELRGWTSFIGLQIQYSLVERAAERELLPMARELDIGVTAWSPLGMGLLTGKYNSPATHKSSDGNRGRLDLPGMTSQGRLQEKNVAIAAEVKKIADENGWKPAQVALAWLRTKNVIPIVGSRTVAQITESLSYVDLSLPPELVARLDAVSKLELGFPHEFIESTRGVILGKTADQLVGHARR